MITLSSCSSATFLLKPNAVDKVCHSWTSVAEAKEGLLVISLLSVLECKHSGNSISFIAERLWIQI